jgi:hypothetical protein
MSREYCRVDDDPSYDYSDYEDNTGYYTPYDSREVDYDPIEQPEMYKRLKEVKTRLGVKQDD